MPRSEALDISPLANAIIQKSAEREAVAEAQAQEAGEQFARNEDEKLAAVRKALAEATDGLTDADEIADAHKTALRKLAEADILPPQANPAFLIGIGRAETERLLRRAQANLLARTPEFSALSDESGDLIEPPDANTAVQEEFDAILASPFIRSSRIARELVDKFRPDIEGEFLNNVAELRLDAQARRAAGMRRQQYAEGFTGYGPGYAGFISLGDADNDVEFTLSSIQDGLAHQRNEEGVQNVSQEFMDALEEWADTNMDEDPTRVRRVLSRVADLQLTPGLPIENDLSGPSRTLNALRERAEETENEDLARENRAQQELQGGTLRIFSNLYAQAMEDNPGLSGSQLTKLVQQDLSEDEQFLKIMDAAGVTELPEDIASSLVSEGQRMFAKGLQARTNEDNHWRDMAKTLAGEGADEETILAIMSEHLSPAALAEFARGDTAGAYTSISQGPGWKAIRTAVDPGQVPPGLAPETDREFKKAQAEAERAVVDQAEVLMKGGMTVNEALRSPEVQGIMDKLEETKTALRTPLFDANAEFEEARSRTDIAGMDAALGKMEKVANPLTYQAARVKRDETVRRSDNERTGMAEFQQGLSGMMGAVMDLLEAEEINPLVAREYGREIVAKYLNRTRAGMSETYKLPVDEQKAAQAAMFQSTSDEIMAEVLGQEKLAKLDTLRVEGPTRASERNEALAQFEIYKRDQSLANVLGADFVAEVLDDPHDTIGVLERATPEKLFGRSLDSLGNDLFDEDPADLDSSLDFWAQQFALGGGLTPEDVIAGKATLVFNGTGSRHQTERLEALGFTAHERTRVPGVPDPFGGPAKHTVDFAPTDGTAAVVNLDTFGGPVFSREVTLPTLHPTLTLLFQSDTALTDWLTNTPDAKRTALYEALNLDSADLKEADKAFRTQQRNRLLKYTTR
jgi:hypothetical protein